MARQVETLMLHWRGAQIECVGAVLELQQDCRFAFVRPLPRQLRPSSAGERRNFGTFLSGPEEEQRNRLSTVARTLRQRKVFLVVALADIRNFFIHSLSLRQSIQLFDYERPPNIFPP